MRILVTHGIGFLSQCDKIIVMSNGGITEVGSYSQLMDKDGAFAELLHNYGTNEGNEEKEKTLEDIAGIFHEVIVVHVNRFRLLLNLPYSTCNASLLTMGDLKNICRAYCGCGCRCVG